MAKCIINKPQDYINYVNSGIDFNEAVLEVFNALLDTPLLTVNQYIEALKYLNEFYFVCSDGQKVAHLDIDKNDLNFSVKSVIPTESFGNIEIKAKKISLSGSIFHGNTIMKCKDTLEISDSYFNPDKKIVINDRELTTDEINAINGNVFKQCKANVSLTIYSSPIDFEIVDDIDPTTIRGIIKDLKDDAITDYLKNKLVQLKYFHELQKCVEDIEPAKELHIDCQNIDSYEFI